MTDPDPGKPLVEGLTARELAFLQGAFELAREGDVDQLVAYIDAG
jgi:hypothetical protein